MEERKINYNSLVSVLKGTQKSDQNSLYVFFLHACEQESLEMCEACIAAGVDINHPFKECIGDEYRPSLIKLLKRNKLTLPVAKFLVENGANLNVDCPLSIACLKGNLEIVKYLLTVGATAKYNDNASIYSTLSYAIRTSSPTNVEILKLLFEYEIHKKTDKQSIEWAFCDSIYGHYDPYEKVKFLLESGLSPNSNILGRTILMNAVLVEKLEIVRLLLQNGADPNAICEENPYLSDLCNHRRVNALMLATHKGNQEIIHILIEYGARI